MAEERPSLRVIAEDVLDDIRQDSASTSLTALFHRVWSVLPLDQEIVDVGPDDSVGDALAKMAEHDFTQLPVRVGETVLGVFSYRSFARKIPELAAAVGRTPIAELPVEGLSDRASFVSQYDELPDLFDALDSVDAVLVGDERRISGILTSVDILRWLHELAEPFVRLGEIERALRDIVSRQLSAEQIIECAERTLAQNYQGREDRLPQRLDRMTFDELRLLVTDGRNWPLLGSALGTNIELVKAKLKPLPNLRNDVFHFRRDLEQADLDLITAARQWLLTRHRAVGAR